MIVAETGAIGLLLLRGYTYESLFLSLLAVGLMRRLGVDRARGLGLVWRRGNWMLLRGTATLPVKLLAGPVATPWLIFLAVVELSGGRATRLWIFRDSVPRAQWRRLQVRSELAARCDRKPGSGR
ncbi:protein YgfX [Candidatus Marimicrobium litorale]|uniref:RDD family protein n=1 Tax=Candidatus Marimicrobium litorale TaxID=2518991 RepID=A0ABT3T3I1_9GAMM|nr:protein YgfX [Candidatus Marimicrobium litorale]MCX2976639.1 hypothetical protein [Candidatus Marimicrobium litorale]